MSFAVTSAGNGLQNDTFSGVANFDLGFSSSNGLGDFASSEPFTSNPADTDFHFYSEVNLLAQNPFVGTAPSGATWGFHNGTDLLALSNDYLTNGDPLTNSIANMDFSTADVSTSTHTADTLGLLTSDLALSGFVVDPEVLSLFSVDAWATDVTGVPDVADASTVAAPEIGTTPVDLSVVSPKDANGNNLYDLAEARGFLPISKAAASIVVYIDGNEEVEVAFFGETHGPVADKMFDSSVQAGTKSNHIPVPVIEAPTTPYLNSLIKQYQEGTLSEKQFLESGAKEMHRDYMAALPNGGIGEPIEGQLSVSHFEDWLRNTVVKYHNYGLPVFLFDQNRYEQAGSRDERMATRLEDIRNQVSGSGTGDQRYVLYVKAGLIHSFGEGTLPLVQPRNTLNGAQVGLTDSLNPAAERLANRIGNAAVLTLLIDEYVGGGSGGGGLGVVAPAGSELSLRRLNNIDYSNVTGSGIRFDSVDFIVPIYDPEAFPNGVDL